MNTKANRRLSLVALSDLLQIFQDAAWVPFSYSIWKLKAALSFPEIEGLDITLHEPHQADPEAIATAILASEPDVVGFSAYMWSFSVFAEATAIIKSRRPEVVVVFGGPSGRPAMFDLDPYVPYRGLVDAICVDEGESILRSMMLATDLSREGLLRLPGLAVWTDSGWKETPKAELLELDSLPSPYQLGLVPKGLGANLETFRGCPLSCAFCEWGAMSSAGRIWSAEYLTREMQAIKDSAATSIYLIDAGLNLNRRAFRNLVAAETEVGLLRSIPVGLHIYATAVSDQDTDFLTSIMVGRLGIGLQTYNQDVAKRLHRHFDEKRFHAGVQALTAVRNTVIELIMGLPYDTPESFRTSVQRAMELPVSGVQVFHSLVLPDGLMTRAPAGSNLVFDHKTLKTISATGWTQRDLAETAEWLSRLAESAGGSWDATMWRLPAKGRDLPRPRAIAAPERILSAPNSDKYDSEAQMPRSVVERSPRAVIDGPDVTLEERHTWGETVIQASGRRIKLTDIAPTRTGDLRAVVWGEGGEVVFTIGWRAADLKTFRWVDGVGVQVSQLNAQADRQALHAVAYALARQTRPWLVGAKRASQEPLVPTQISP
jgi:radical SAM superfamily enzyme YgiQ (UPF0313 family)